MRQTQEKDQLFLDLPQDPSNGAVLPPITSPGATAKLSPAYISSTPSAVVPNNQLELQELIKQAHQSSVESFQLDDTGSRIVRHIKRLDGSESTTSIDITSLIELDSNYPLDDLHAAFDAAWLRSSTPPSATPIPSHTTIRIVDLFSGCGGMSLGISEACRALGYHPDVIFAADLEKTALEIFQENLGCQEQHATPLEEILQIEDLDAPLSSEEHQLAKRLQYVDVLVGGPPCQGHSNLNNKTRRDDPKNRLIRCMARFARIVPTRHIVIENVPAVVQDKGKAIHETRQALSQMAYHINNEHIVLDASHFGVAQQRKRYFLIASQERSVSMASINLYKVNKARSFLWACADLMDYQPTPEKTGENFFDTAPVSGKDNIDRINYLFDNGEYDLPNSQRPDCHKDGHTYPSVYGRIYAGKPTATITGGIGSMGQGRFVHPKHRRLITPHEAARLQFFPDFFRFDTPHRKSMNQMIGNAVPSKLAYIIGLELLR
jgi:DNA (cytosine-5)-methyltransferase 1